MTYEEFETEFCKLIEKYLYTCTPRNIHEMILSWNFDNPKSAVIKIVNCKKTDKATALMLYWLMEPGYAKQYEDADDLIKRDSAWYREDFNIIETLEENYLSNYYSSENFAFDPKNDYWGMDRTLNCEYENCKRKIPNIMLQPIKGIPVKEPNGWTDGIAPDIQKEYDELISQVED